MKSSIHLFYGIIIGILILLISGCGGAYAEKKRQERERRIEKENYLIPNIFPFSAFR